MLCDHDREFKCRAGGTDKDPAYGLLIEVFKIHLGKNHARRGATFEAMHRVDEDVA